MNRIRNVVLAIQFSEGMEKTWLMVKQMSFLKEANIHFVHVSPSAEYTFIHPSAENKIVIEHAINAKLESMARNMLPAGFLGRAIPKCLFASNPKRTLCEYAEKIKADITIAAVDSDKPVSFGSFIQYLCFHSTTHVMVLKPKS